ncbi:hypothetical protein M514_12459 [Trichuris suis]|uniref:PPM-type phosphatase domain-containing protein n=1 Tax=Trichuris suis TaxID=68888 RepID=A0A085N3W4_9BILA|nr:hypothetical protein M513_12459 [Trichuris suis]KFD64160.1 hypothetical protein M514_12459 [Trichuris suis]KHJ47193.1 protein phosphatase 2C [Trichuris suis]
MGPGVSGRNRLRVSVCCNQGGRRYMEDRVSIFCERDKDGCLGYVFLAVFDGHGGSDASEMAQKRLRANIVQNPGFLSDNDDDVLEAIKDGFLITQSQMLHEVENWPKTSSGFPSTSGTTASVAFIRHNKVYIGHVGDSAIALGKRFPDGSVVGSKLTTDHKPDDPEEQRRIWERGGEVMSKSGVKRVVWVRPVRPNSVKRPTLFEKIPFLAVARALGDLWSYNSSKDDFVVSPVPDVSMVQLQPDDVCLVIGSDGLWNVLNAQNVVEIVNCNEWKDCPSGWNACESKTCGLEINHARWIARQALIRWGRLRADNISVITVLFDRCGSGASSSYSRSSVINDEEVLDIEQVLTDQPSAVVHIRAERVLALRTSPVELFYYGTVETVANSQLPPRFCGPGYTEYSEGTTLLCLNCKSSDGAVQATDSDTNGDQEADKSVREDKQSGEQIDVYLKQEETKQSLICARDKNSSYDSQVTTWCSLHRSHLDHCNRLFNSATVEHSSNDSKVQLDRLSIDMIRDDKIYSRRAEAIVALLVSPKKSLSSYSRSGDLESARLLESLNLETSCRLQSASSSCLLSVDLSDRMATRSGDCLSDLLTVKRREGITNDVTVNSAKRFKCAEETSRRTTTSSPLMPR